MRCHKARKLISEYLDGTLEARRAAELERHVETCAACREILEDFRAVAEAASRLESPKPGDAVWLKIKARLRAREREFGVAGETGAPPVRARGGMAPAWKFAAAAALALVLVGTGVFFGLRLGRQTVPAAFGDSEKYTLAKLDEAERYYEKAIKALSEAFSSQKGGMAPQVVEMFEKNLSVIDATIQACRQAVLSEPDDLEARNYLLAAYMDKVSFLDTALESQRQNPGAPIRGKAL
jgi:tetratricopeptide (TPR) repeat protein